MVSAHIHYITSLFYLSGHCCIELILDQKNYTWPPVKVWACNIQTVIFSLSDVLISPVFCLCSSSSFQAIDSIHQVGVYCLALVPANTLPKAPLGGIHISETKQRFLEGALHPCNVLMCPHTCVTNLPKPRQKQPGRLRNVPVRIMCGISSKKNSCLIAV